MAGGGKPGAICEAPAEFWYNVIENGVHGHDFNATIRHLMGIDHERLAFKYHGRKFRLTDVHGELLDKKYCLTAAGRSASADQQRPISIGRSAAAVQQRCGPECVSPLTNTPSMSDLRAKVLQFVSKDADQFPGYLQQGAMAMVWSTLETQDELGVSGDIVEIGVFEGKLFALLSLGLKEGERSIGIDTFLFGTDPPEVNRARVMQRLIDNGFSESKFQLLICDSATLDPQQLADLSDQQIRLFSVDGDHSRVGARRDLKLAAQVTSARGVIVADDLYNAWYPGVTDAIYDFIDGQHTWVPFVLSSTHGPLHTGCSKLFFCHRDQLATYRAYFRVLNGENFLRESAVLSQPIDIYAFNKPIVRRQLNDQRRREIEETRKTLDAQISG